MKNEFVLFTSKDILSSIPHLQLNPAHGALYIYNYRDDCIKKLILAVKNLDKKALEAVAKTVYISICSHVAKKSAEHETNTADIQASNPTPTLILHAPSSSFAVAKKSADHMALVLNLISDIQHESYEGKKSHIKIDTAPYLFIHRIPPRIPQHIKSRMDRLADIKEKFQLIYHIPPLLLAQYRYIYIVDDVLTTGSTLQGLKQVLIQYCAEHNIYPTIHTLAVCH